MHHLKGHEYVGSRHYLTFESQTQTLLCDRSYHQKRRNELRTHRSIESEVAPMQATSGDAQRRITLFSDIFYFGTQISERIHQHPYRTMTHSLTAVEHYGASFACGIICCKETHGGSGCPYVYHIGIIGRESLKHRVCVITLSHISETRGSIGEGIYDESTVTHAF